MITGYEKPTITPLYGEAAAEPEAIVLVLGPVVGVVAGVGAVAVWVVRVWTR